MGCGASKSDSNQRDRRASYIITKKAGDDDEVNKRAEGKRAHLDDPSSTNQGNVDNSEGTMKLNEFEQLRLDKANARAFKEGHRGSIEGHVCAEPSAVGSKMKKGWAHMRAVLKDHLQTEKDKKSLEEFHQTNDNYKPPQKLVERCQYWLTDVHEAVEQEEKEVTTPTADANTTVVCKPCYLDKIIGQTSPSGLMGLTGCDEGDEVTSVSSDKDGAESRMSSLVAPSFISQGMNASLNSMASMASKISMASKGSMMSNASRSSNVSRASNGLSTMKLANGSTIMRKKPAPRGLGKRAPAKNAGQDYDDDYSNLGSSSSDTSSLASGGSFRNGKPNVTKVVAPPVDDMDALMYGGGSLQGESTSQSFEV